MMYITYRDEVGGVTVEVHPEYGISFLEGKVFFTDTNGKDYKISVDAVVEISLRCSNFNGWGVI